MDCRPKQIQQDVWQCRREDCKRIHVQNYKSDKPPIMQCRTNKVRVEKGKG